MIKYDAQKGSDHVDARGTVISSTRPTKKRGIGDSSRFMKTRALTIELVQIPVDRNWRSTKFDAIEFQHFETVSEKVSNAPTKP